MAMVRVVVLIVIVRMRACHVVGRERWEVVAAVVAAVSVVWVMSVAVVWHVCGWHTALTLDLSGSRCQEVDIHLRLR